SSSSFLRTSTSRVDYALALPLACHGIVIALSFLTITRLSKGFPQYSEPSAAREARMIEGGHNSDARYSTTLGLAGHVCSLRTDSVRLMEITGAFFPFNQDREASAPRAAITLLTGCRRGSSIGCCTFPIFRGRNEFVHADYGREGSVWFDLKAREVAGVLSEGIIADVEYLRRAVLAVIAGVLAPSLGVIVLHAGCVVRDGRAILLAAHSGEGKSTLSLALALRGWSLLSDEWTFVSAATNGLSVWGMQTSVKLMPDASLYFPLLTTLSPTISLNEELSFEIDPWILFGVNRAIDATPLGIIFLKRAQDSGEHICHASQFGAEETMKTLLEEIEEQPEAIADQNRTRQLLMQQLCRLPALKVSFSGNPAVVAADLDKILTEQLCV
ncbi:MAG: hypothetical protein ABSG00_07455, partial [Terracidiphilus sp.]